MSTVIMSVSIWPGATAFTVIPSFVSLDAYPPVRPFIPAFEAE